MTSAQPHNGMAHVNRAACDNISPHFFSVLRKIGLEVVVVVLDVTLKSPVHSNPKVEEGLGLELQAAGFGMFDSNFYLPESRWALFHVPRERLGEAMKLLKAQLAVRCLAGVSTIMHAEEFNQMRIWYSADPKSNAALVEG